MGYWTTDRDGHSFAESPNVEMLWGDHPADIMDDAIAHIRAAFREDVGREPTLGEIRAGLEFSLMGKPDEEDAATALTV